jgi:CheY-like chemotaxis protein
MDEKDRKRAGRSILSLLLAEDDDPLRESLVSFFLSEGYKVYPARTGTEAVEIALTRKVSFSIMDVNMPGLTGIEAFKYISDEMGQMPCIFMSGDSSRDLLRMIEEAGAFSFLPKPIRIAMMKRSVEKLVGKYFLCEE